jgi:hypothetical protein
MRLNVEVAGSGLFCAMATVTLGVNQLDKKAETCHEKLHGRTLKGNCTCRRSQWKCQLETAQARRAALE